MCCSAAFLRDPRGTLFVSARGRAPTRQQRVSWAVSRRRSSRYRSLQVPGIHSAAGCTYGTKSASARRAGRTKPMRKNRSEQAPPMEQDGISRVRRVGLSRCQCGPCGLTEAGPNLDSSLVGSQMVFKLDVGWELGVVTEQLKRKPQVCSVPVRFKEGSLVHVRQISPEHAITA